VPGLYPEENFLLTASTRSAIPTNFIAGPLGARAALHLTHNRFKKITCMTDIFPNFI